MSGQPMPLHGETARVVEDVTRSTADGWRVALVFKKVHGPAKRAVEVLHDAGIGISLVETISEAPAPGQPVATTGTLGNGLIDEVAEVRDPDRQRHLRRPWLVHQGHAQDAGVVGGTRSTRWSCR